MAGRSTLIGNEGETEAMNWLRKQGYMLRERNWRSGSYEIDLIFERWGVIHFVEVKTRKFDSWTSPTEAITKDKLRSIARAARMYIAQHNITLEVQFDLVGVIIEENGEKKLCLYENILEFRW